MSLYRLLHCFCGKTFTFCFRNSENSQQYYCFSLLNLFVFFMYPNSVLPVCVLPITFDFFSLLSILFASTATFHFLPLCNSGTLSLTDPSSGCYSCNNSITLSFLNFVTKPCTVDTGFHHSKEIYLTYFINT